MIDSSLRRLRQAGQRLAFVLAATMLAGAASGANAPAVPTPAVSQPLAPLPPLTHFRVLWMHDPSEKAVIWWTTPTEGTSHVIHYDIQPRQGKIAAYAAQGGGVTEHQIHDGEGGRRDSRGLGAPWLAAGSAARNDVSLCGASDGNVSREFLFITAPADDRPLKLIFG